MSYHLEIPVWYWYVFGGLVVFGLVFVSYWSRRERLIKHARLMKLRAGAKIQLFGRDQWLSYLFSDVSQKGVVQLFSARGASSNYSYLSLDCGKRVYLLSEQPLNSRVAQEVFDLVCDGDLSVATVDLFSHEWDMLSSSYFEGNGRESTSMDDEDVTWSLVLCENTRHSGVWLVLLQIVSSDGVSLRSYMTTQNVGMGNLWFPDVS